MGNNANDEAFTSLRKQANDRLNKSNYQKKENDDDAALSLLTEEKEKEKEKNDPFEDITSASAKDLFSEKNENDKMVIMDQASPSIEAEFAKLNDKMSKNEKENKLNQQQSAND